MTRDLLRMDDPSFDRLLANVLRREAERVAGTQPDGIAAAARFAASVTAPRGWHGTRAVAAVAWLVLLLLAVVATALVGGPLLDRDAPLEAGPLGLGSPCGQVDIETGALATISSVGDHPGSHVTTYFENGLVTDVVAGNLGLTAPGRPRGLAIMNTSWYEGRLSTHGLNLVRERLAGLKLEAGCYSVRLPTRSIEDGNLAVRTAGGSAFLTWSGDGGASSIDPLLSARDGQLVLEILRDLMEPDPNRARDVPDLVATWLPAEAWVEPIHGAASRWLVHVMLTPTDYPPTAVLGQGSGPPASSTDGRFDAVELPGDATLQTFGQALALPGLGLQRCGILDHSDALRLARTLGDVELGVDAEADLFTPDMAWGIDVEIIPARSIDDCATLEAQLRAHSAPAPSAAIRQVTGDLAAVDPCSLVPPELRGEIQPFGYGMPKAPMGVAARSCLIERRAHMGVLRGWTSLWLYPRTVTEGEAATLAAAILGDRTATVELAGGPASLNHCLAGFEACTGAVATWRSGRFLVLEISSDVISPQERTRRALEILERIVAALPER